jgi:hypothetical protein
MTLLELAALFVWLVVFLVIIKLWRESNDE